MRAAFDRDGLVNDVALDPRGRRQAHLQTAHAAHDAAVDHDVVRHDLAADRRRLAHALTEWPLAVTASRGYNFAEATAGGVSLDEIRWSTMESRVCPGLYLTGEILDVDGRIGGFNFQWAWASARVAAAAIAARGR